MCRLYSRYDRIHWKNTQLGSMKLLLYTFTQEAAATAEDVMIPEDAPKYLQFLNSLPGWHKLQ